MMKKLVCVVLALLVMVSCSTVFAADIPLFSDVDENRYGWAIDAIESFAKQGIVEGTGDGTFNPDGKVTREEFAKVLTLAFGETPQKDAEQTFSDVSKDRWSYGYIEASRNFLTGYKSPAGGKMTFKPMIAASREDIAVALVRILKYDVSTNGSTYAEGKFSDYHDISIALRPYINVAVEKGLIYGHDGAFRPQAGISRAETVVLLSRAMKQVAVNDPEVQPPMPEIPAADAPTLSISAFPTSVETNSVKIQGSVTDKKDSKPTLTVNGKSVQLSGEGKFNVTVALSEGKNIISVIAGNMYGKTAEETYSVIYTPAPKVEEKPISRGNCWGYIVTDPELLRIGDSYYQGYSVWNGSETIEVREKRNSIEPSATLVKGVVISYVYLGHGEVENMKVVGTMQGAGIGAIVTYNDKNDVTIEVAGKPKHYKMDANTVILRVRSKKVEASYGNALTIAHQSAEKMYIPNALFYDENSDATLDLVVVDADHEWQINPITGAKR